MEVEESKPRYSWLDISIVIFLATVNAGVSIIAWALSAPGQGATASHSAFGTALLAANLVGLVGGLWLALRGKRSAVLLVVSVLPILFAVIFGVASIGRPPDKEEQACRSECNAKGNYFPYVVKGDDRWTCECR